MAENTRGIESNRSRTQQEKEINGRGSNRQDAVTRNTSSDSGEVAAYQQGVDHSEPDSRSRGGNQHGAEEQIDKNQSDFGSSL